MRESMVYFGSVLGRLHLESVLADYRVGDGRPASAQGVGEHGPKKLQFNGLAGVGQDVVSGETLGRHRMPGRDRATGLMRL